LELIEPTTEDAMVLAFLRAEIESPTYQQNLLRVAGAREIVDSGDLKSEEENAIRRMLLGSHRGYGWALFEGFPNDLVWHRARLTVDELRTTRYANYPTWLILTGRTRLIADGAKNIGMPWPTGSPHQDPSPSIRKVVEMLEQGASFDELIFVGEPDAPADQWVLVEGHTRATAYVREGATTEVQALIGFSPGVVKWRWF
jgi:hypothetical protein